MGDRFKLTRRQMLQAGAVMGTGLIFGGLWGCSRSSGSGSGSASKGVSAQTNPENRMEEQAETSKILVAYFSHTGNTRTVATQIVENVGGDIFEILTVDPYPSAYDAVTAQAKKEQESGYKPSLQRRVENIESYNMVFLGYPNWWGTIPPALDTFLSEYDFSGKIIVPFCTHEGSRLGRSVTDIAQLCPESTILDGLAIRGRDVDTAQEDVGKWLRTIGMFNA